MKRNLYHIKAVLLALCVVLAIAGATLAQGGNNQQNTKPTLSKDEAKAAEPIEKATTIDAKFAAAEAFLQKYPKSTIRPQLASHLADQVAGVKDASQKVTYGEKFFNLFTEVSEQDEVIPHLLDGYWDSKKYDEAFQLTENFLSRHGDDVSILAKMGIKGTNLLRQGNTKFAKQTVGYANKAIELIEADKKPANMDDATWTSYKTKYIGVLYQSSGVISMMTNNPTDARTKFEKAKTASPTDPINYYFLGFIVDSEYQVTVKAYQASQSGKQRDDLLVKANTQIDTVIDYYARAVAMAEGNPQYQAVGAQIRADLETYYKYRHNNSLTGLQELINKYKPISLKP